MFELLGMDNFDLEDARSVLQSCAIASKINGTPKGARLSEKLQLTAALSDEI